MCLLLSNKFYLVYLHKSTFQYVIIQKSPSFYELATISIPPAKVNEQNEHWT